MVGDYRYSRISGALLYVLVNQTEPMLLGAKSSPPWESEPSGGQFSRAPSTLSSSLVTVPCSAVVTVLGKASAVSREFFYPLGNLSLAAGFAEADQRLRFGKRGKLSPQPLSLVVSSSSFCGLLWVSGLYIARGGGPALI